MEMWWILLLILLLIVSVFLLMDLGKRIGLFDALNDFATMYNEQYDLDAEPKDEKQF